MATANSLTPFQRFMTSVGAFIIIALTILMLKVGASILIPLAIALVVWYILITLSNILQRFSIAEKHLPEWLTLLLAIATFSVVIWIFAAIINSNYQSLVLELPIYQEKINDRIGSIGTYFGFEGLSAEVFFANFDFPALYKRLAGEIGNGARLSGGILVYVIFLLLEYRKFGKKLEFVFHNRRQLRNVEKILSRINEDVQTYIGIQSLASLLTASCVYLVLKIFGLPFAEFWALLTFVLNYIPVFGSILATVFPVLTAVVEFNNLVPVAILTMIIVAIQFLIGNILLPRFMGNSLNLSPLTILISLAVWGKIWGITGMFLSVPIMVIINIILARFAGTRWVAVLLSGNGKVR